jgi:cysteine-rich repeat protein
VAVLAVLLAGTGAATDHPIAGTLLRLRDQGPRQRSATFRATTDTAIVPSLAEDPRMLGATLEITGRAPGDGATGVLSLPGTLWRGLGRPTGSKGYVYLDPRCANGVRKIAFRTGRHGGSLIVGARGRNWPYQIQQPQGAIDVSFTIGSEVYCTRFTAFSHDKARRVVAHRAVRPLSCGPGVCGNGVLEDNEECDDGNTVSGDGCSATCEFESAAALCAGVPTVTGTALGTVLVASGLTMPLHLTAPALDPTRIFVVEQPGRIRLIKNGVLLDDPFLAIEDKVSCCNERGLLSVAFHPDFAHNGRFFVDYTNTAGDTVIARYQANAVHDTADPASEQILLTIAQPFANHNGGQLAFGPDGYLYLGMGDGGSGGDPLGNGQSDATLLGKLLRLDVNVEMQPYYRPPPSNPFVGAGDPQDKVWAKGLRNPWRFSFDRGTGDLYIGDVGQDSWEEVDVQPAASHGGENYGWSVFEASHCFHPVSPATDCPDPPIGLVMPVTEYAHDPDCSVTGGFVYRGCRLPDLRGTYFYSDYCTGRIRTFRGVSGGVAQNAGDLTADLAPGAGRSIDNVSSFGEDARGEVYIVDYDGEIYKIVPREDL